jgi:SAM-dependent methyltransferase
MSEAFSGLRSALSNPWIYRGFTRLVGGDRAYRIFVSQYAHPVAGERVLDIGCGPGHLLPYFPVVEYVGFDADPAYIESACKHYGSRGRFFCADIGAPAFREPGRFDLAVAYGVIHHLDDGLASRLFQEAHGLLRPGGRLVTCDGCWAHGQSPVARWLLARDRGHYIRTLPELVALAGPFFPNVESQVRQDLLRIPYAHCLLTCRA